MLSASLAFQLYLIQTTATLQAQGAWHAPSDSFLTILNDVNCITFTTITSN